MALTELDIKRWERELAKFMERRRPPPHIRPQLDLGYRISGQSVELFEIRPAWDNPEEIIEHPVAKATYVRSSNHWQIFWMRRDLKWHGYKPNPQVASLEAFLGVVDRDDYCCFFG